MEYCLILTEGQKVNMLQSIDLNFRGLLTCMGHSLMLTEGQKVVDYCL